MKIIRRVVRVSRKTVLWLAIATFVFAIMSHSVVDAIASAQPDWIKRSNENTNLLTEAESAKQCSDLALSKSLLQLDSNYGQCREKGINTLLQRFQTKLKQERDPAVKLDLEILIQSATESLKSDEFHRQLRLPYVDLAKEIHNSLDDLSRPDLVKLLQQLNGDETGKPAIATLAIQNLRGSVSRPNIFFPSKSQIEKDLSNTSFQLERIQKRLEQQKIDQESYTKLKAQITEYTTFVRQEILPKSRLDFRLSPELYALELQERGVEISIDELLKQAHTAFESIQQEMDVLAAQVAKQKGLQTTGYREVIRSLKKEQLPADKILPQYEQRQKDLEAIIRREKLVTLPKRNLTIRLTNDRENTNFPVPQYFPPKSSQKTAGVFIVPLLKPDKQPRAYDDFTYPAVAWTLTAHEGRPGHDLQFTTIQDKGTSEARSRFGYNPANHEGWALYAEAITLPFMPIEGQFISLQFQLLRAARAFLEPELHLGKVSIDEAMRILTEDVGFSKFFAQQEINRYTVKLPGHAPSYFYGYQKLMQLRQEVEKQMGQQFNQTAFHDFILAQGFMPQQLLRQTVLEQFVAAKTKSFPSYLR
ncbi:MAG: DUF885 domain-containing protein [Leptolyngbya sp. UWPOB_LEPTO1]|uniref:DUF885 domain-containing protein n=1 Tax=Leptolyngbya sp. UWPOB_LEPTO1 TaxID=2815653 RepID=UPI001AC4776D|nr:DUF885 domain-containing protein [Leptolyngbya sp. UWPOB_LEPTO1]MBN8560603.1 DUF885 domain-containing protein [Leptolyngbya sp. UWPOB_LEPTO1]